MKSLIVIAVIFSLAAAKERTWPDFIVEEVGDAGLLTLGTEYNATLDARAAARQALDISNATCIEKYDLAFNSCISCINEKCLARVEAVCQTENTTQIKNEIQSENQKPQQWQIVLGKTIGFATQDVPGFFTNTIPDVFENTIPGGVADAVRGTGNFVENTGAGIINTGNTIAGGIAKGGSEALDFGAGIGKDFTNGVVDATKVIQNVAVDGVNTIVDGVNTAVDEIEDFGNNAIKTIGNILGLGKRSVRMRRQAQAEPGCPEFQSNATVACEFYLNPTYCSSCAFNRSIECPQFIADFNNAEEVYAATTKVATITDGTYAITEMKFDTVNYDFETGGFTDVAVKATIFGTNVTFTIAEPIDANEPEVAGPIVALKALEAFKSA